MKKVLSLVLVIAMVLSSMSFAFAGTTFSDVAEDNDYAEAIKMLTDLGIIKGYEDGTYKPEKTITRAEMATLMVKALGYEDLVSGSKSNFTDTQGHWADPYIALAAGKGIVLGTGNGKFDPDRQVTYDEVITMLVRGLGYTDNCNELKGMTWPTNFKVKAAELDITDGVTMNGNGADRGGVAQLIANALEATLVSVTIDGDVTFLQDTIDDEKVDRILLTRVATPDYNYEVTTEVLDPDNKNYGGDVVKLEQYMFQNIDAYLNDDDEVVYVKGTNSLVVEGTVDDVDGEELSVKTASGKVVDIDVNDDTIDSDQVFENGSLRETKIDLIDLEDTDTIKVVADDADEDGKIESKEIVGYVTTIQTDVVRIDKEYVEGKDSLNGLVLPVDDDDKVVLEKITVEGDANSLEDIELNDIVVEYLAEDETITRLVVTRNVVEGKVSRVDDKNTFYIDGTKYDIADVAVIKYGTENPYSVGDEGAFFLNHDGKVVDYDGEGMGPQDYAVVVGIAGGDTDTDRFDDSLSVDTYPTLKLATQEDETVEYDIEVSIDEGAIDEAAEDEDGDKIVTLTNGDLNVVGVKKYSLIKYELNDDKRISEIEVVAEDITYDEINLEKSANELLSDAVIFDATDNDYDVVNADVLPTDPQAYAVRNRNGEIEVLVVAAGEIDKALEVSYAYIYNVDQATNNDEKVQYVGAYTDGQDKGIYADDDDVFKSGEEKVYGIDFDGDVIEEANVVSNKATVNASDVNANKGMIKIGSDWYAMSEHGTVVNVDIDKDGKYAEDGLADLYDVDEDTDIEVYYNGEKEVDLILIVQSDARPVTPVDPQKDGVVTYITTAAYNTTFDRFDVEDKNGTKSSLFTADFTGFKFKGTDGELAVSEEAMTAWLDTNPIALGKTIEVVDGKTLVITSAGTAATDKSEAIQLVLAGEVAKVDAVTSFDVPFGTAAADIEATVKALVEDVVDTDLVTVAVSGTAVTLTSKEDTNEVATPAPAAITINKLGAIGGTVTYGTNPVAGAVVEITVGTDKVTATTAADGTYTIANVPAATYTVTVKAEGYIDGTVSATVANDGVKVSANVTLGKDTTKPAWTSVDVATLTVGKITINKVGPAAANEIFEAESGVKSVVINIAGTDYAGTVKADGSEVSFTGLPTVAAGVNYTITITDNAGNVTEVIATVQP